MTPVRYPPRIDLAQLPTPLQPLDRLSARLSDTRIWIKRDDLTGSVTGGNKVRKLEFTLAAAIEAGCNTVITCGGLQSNHCRTTALLCARLGLQCHLVLRGEPAGDSDGNLLLDQLAGARISCYSTRRYQAELEQLLSGWREHYASRGDRAWIIPTGASDGIGCWGYVRACEELAADFATHGIAPKHIVTATGSGGTQAGLTVGSVLFDLDCTVWGINVCDDEAWFLNKVAADIADWRRRFDAPLSGTPDIRVIDGYVGPGYARADREIFETIAELAALEGVVLDPVYTGKAFHGMLRELAAGRFAGSTDLVFIHTGGVFGLFPQRNAFGFLEPPQRHKNN